MARPTNRTEFKDYILRQLGAPVVDINVDDEQVEDRIDDALDYYHDYHFDGTERTLEKIQVTQADRDNGYFTLDEEIIGVIRVFDIGDSVQTSNLFNIRYQIHLNDLFDFTSTTYVPYVTAMRHIETLEEIFVGSKPIRYNRHINRLHIDMDWSEDVEVGSFVIAEAYRITDPNLYADVWKDRWMRRYATCLIKQQWGTNLKKFEGMQMPGGLTFNGQKIWEEATEERRQLEDEMMTSYSLPSMDMMN